MPQPLVLLEEELELLELLPLHPPEGDGVGVGAGVGVGVGPGLPPMPPIKVVTLCAGNEAVNWPPDTLRLDLAAILSLAEVTKGATLVTLPF